MNVPMELVYLRYVNDLSTREDHPKVVYVTPISTNLGTPSEDLDSYALVVWFG